MALLERVATLLRANLNDIVNRAEDPVVMMNQVILDMQNQLLQVKTQVAIAIADQHLLTRKRDENRTREADWMRKAEMALQKHDEELARVALQRSLASRDLAKSFDEQLGDQRVQVENLRAALHNLDAKLAETRAQGELLAAQNRRARGAHRAGSHSGDLHNGDLQSGDLRPGDPPPGNGLAAGIDGMAQARDQVERELAIGRAKADLLSGDSLEERFAKLEKQDEIDRLLAELKSKQAIG